MESNKRNPKEVSLKHSAISTSYIMNQISSPFSKCLIKIESQIYKREKTAKLFFLHFTKTVFILQWCWKYPKSKVSFSFINFLRSLKKQKGRFENFKQNTYWTQTVVKAEKKYNRNWERKTLEKWGCGTKRFVFKKRTP